LRAVIDEGVPRRLAGTLRSLGLKVSPFPPEWKGLSNGKLLSAVEEAGFDCMLTCDRNIRNQQRMSGRSVGLLVLPAQRFDDLLPFVPVIASELTKLRRGEVIVMERSLSGEGT